MASSYYGELPIWVKTRELLNIGFSFAFTIEAIIKIVAFGWAYYGKFHWNKFDFSLVVVSWIDVVVTAVFGASLD